VWDP